ncbi:SMC-Scp complex subunit ScpB [Tsukamurella serpentis]
MEPDELRSALEALLLVVDAPATGEQLGAALEEPEERITADLRAWAAELTERRSGMQLRESAEGWRLYSRAEYAPYVERLLLDGVRSKLTRAALETLAVIAYKQPVSRSKVSAVRGVNVDGVMRTLAARGLIAEAGTDPTSGAAAYSTTDLFLERLGLTSLDELPALAPLLPEVDVIEDLSANLDDEPRFAKLGRKSADVIGFDPDA